MSLNKLENIDFGSKKLSLEQKRVKVRYKKRQFEKKGASINKAWHD